jgi:TolA-binding protein
VNRSLRKSLLSAFALLFYVGLSICTGCGPKQSAQPASTAKASSAPAPTPQGEESNRRQLLQSAINLLNSPEQFRDENQLDEQIFERLNQWQRAEGSASDDPTADDNQKSDTTGRKSDSLIDGLSPELQQLRVVKRLNSDRFNKDYDGTFLREAVILRDVADHIQPEKRDDLSVAQALFDWTVRNIQLQPQPGTDATPDEQWLARHLPLETVFFGRATPLQRAWVFMLLARQAGLDVVLLALPDARNADQPRPWVTALVDGNDLYLFDFTYGVPILGPGGKGVATLAQAAADDKILRQMDTGDRPYPRKSADLQKVTALLEASPGYLAPRLKDLESKLSGNDRIVLSFDPTSLAEKLRKLDHVDAVKLWTFPYETLQQRAKVSPDLMIAAQLERFPFSFNGDVETPSKKQSEQRSQEHQVEALRLARYLQLRGMFGSSDAERPDKMRGKELSEMMERGAKYYYLRALPRQAQIEDFARMQRQGEVLAPGRPVTKEFVDAYQTVRDDAAYWLGVVWLELGANKTAVDYLGRMTLEAYPNANSPWANGARYNLARAYEAMGKNADAIRLYEADRSPQRYGNKLRAERLKTAASEKSANGSESKK